MKLIDAEALKDDGANYVWARFADCSLIKKEIRFVNREQIDNAPTVEAIPIEWIDGYIKRRIKVAGMYAEMLFIIDMVKEWEAENGRKEQ